MGFRYYTKKPVRIRAEQYHGDTTELTYDFGRAITRSIAGGSCFIGTLEGEMECRVGDFIIEGVNGEFYPCKPDIFEKTYDLV
jgi:hypothetical protein